MVQFAGKYQLVRAENSEEILKAAGSEVTPEKIAGMNSTDSTLTVTVDGDNYSFVTTITAAYSRETKFTIGKPFEEEIPGGDKKVSTTATIDGNKIVLVSAGGGKRYYEFTDTTATMVIDFPSGVQAKRIYNRV